MELDPASAHRRALTTARALLDSRRELIRVQLREHRAHARYSQLSSLAGMLAALDEARALLEPTHDANERFGLAQALTNTLLKRQLEEEDLLDDALRSGRLNEVSVLDGKSTGFLVALRIIQDEFQPARGNPAAMQRARRSPG